jgi:hypothetical protein
VQFIKSGAAPAFAAGVSNIITLETKALRVSDMRQSTICSEGTKVLVTYIIRLVITLREEV